MSILFRRLGIACAASLALLLSGGNATAAGGYEIVDPPQNTADPDKVEVLEFFWLGCPHCYAFEPSIEGWAEDMPENVVLRREAPPLNRSWESHSRGFYAAQLLGKEQEFVEAMFEAIHEDRKPMRDPEAMADLAAELGMDREKFLATMRSFAVQTKMNRASQLARGAGISGVPTIVVNGKYRTGARLAGGNAGIIDVIDETVAMEKRAMGLE